MVLPKPDDAPVQQLFDLTGKVVVITGGARGIGLSVATAYAEAGAKIAILYRTTATAPQTAQVLASKYQTQCRAYQADVTVPAQISAAIDEVNKDFGKLDVVEIMNVNVNGAFHTARAVARIFKRQGFGNAVFTASVSTTLVNTPQRQAAYNASKARVLQLAKSLAVERSGLCRVNCVSPGYIQTQIMEYATNGVLDKWLGQILARCFASPYELKRVYLFCASDASSYMTGSNLVVDGGFTLP
ncbi:NAD(P)-binding protein [Penicillium canescens]|nr:NAD(P)-binding protein [Penicillium canescens]